MIAVLLCSPGEAEVYRVPSDDALEFRRKLAARVRDIAMGTMMEADLTGERCSVSLSCYRDDEAPPALVEAARGEVPR